MNLLEIESVGVTFATSATSPLPTEVSSTTDVDKGYFLLPVSNVVSVPTVLTVFWMTAFIDVPILGRVLTKYFGDYEVFRVQVGLLLLGLLLRQSLCNVMKGLWFSLLISTARQQPSSSSCLVELTSSRTAIPRGAF